MAPLRTGITMTMQPIRSLAPCLLIAAALFAGTGCGSPVESRQPPRSDGSITATMNGAAWTSTRANATYASTTLRVTGRDASDSIVVDILLYNVIGAGTYDIGTTDGVTVSAAYGRKDGIGYSTPLTVPPRMSGTVAITTMTGDSVAGTFRFTGYRNGDAGSHESLDVRDGSFRLRTTR